MRRTKVFLVISALAAISCGGGSNSTQQVDASTVGSVLPGQPPWGATVDASADKPKTDVLVADSAIKKDLFADSPVKMDTIPDSPMKMDTIPDSPVKTDTLRPDARILDSGLACSIWQACTVDSDCQSGQLCLKYSMNGSASSLICIPAKCKTCATAQTCIVDIDNTCDFFSCQSNDAGVKDAPKDVSANKPDAATSGIDATPVDADTTPVPLDAMPPSWAAACTLAATEPCGGDLTGKWNIVGDCDNWMSETEFAATYGGTCASFGDSVDTGAFVFSADGTCKKDEVLTYKIDLGVKCITDNKWTCSDFDKGYKEAIGAKDSEDMISGSCSLKTEANCYCERTYDYTGTSCLYTVKGTSYTTTYSNGSQDVHDYCVHGDVLSIFYPAYSSVGTALGAKEVFVLKRAN